MKLSARLSVDSERRNRLLQTSVRSPCRCVDPILGILARRGLSYCACAIAESGVFEGALGSFCCRLRTNQYTKNSTLRIDQSFEWKVERGASSQVSSTRLARQGRRYPAQDPARAGSTGRLLQKTGKDLAGPAYAANFIIKRVFADCLSGWQIVLH